MSIIRALEARNVATYGSARWAEDKEICLAGSLGPDGVVLGRYGRDYLRHDGPEHVLCFAPTRSGKGVGLVVSAIPHMRSAGISMSSLGSALSWSLVTLAGLPILGIGATFWRLVFGVAASLILEPWDFSTKPEG